jgi:hypothetical protein
MATVCKHVHTQTACSVQSHFMTTYVPSLTLCSDPGCNFRVFSREGIQAEGLERCPKCKAAVISICPQCAYSLLGNPDPRRPICVVCRADVRAEFSRRYRTAAA